MRNVEGSDLKFVHEIVRKAYSLVNGPWTASFVLVAHPELGKSLRRLSQCWWINLPLMALYRCNEHTNDMWPCSPENRCSSRSSSTFDSAYAAGHSLGTWEKKKKVRIPTRTIINFSARSNTHTLFPWLDNLPSFETRNWWWGFSGERGPCA